MADPHTTYDKIVGEAPAIAVTSGQSANESALVGWVMNRVEQWRDYRDENFKSKWEEYYRLWRGVWLAEDKTRNSERSKLISPALQQAIEGAVAELEEATFGRTMWLDMIDDVDDQMQMDMGRIRDKLLEEFELNGVPQAISEVYLNGAIYGTGIGKIVIEEIEDKSIQSRDLGNGTQENGIETKDKFRVRLEPVAPEEFVIDSSVNRPGKEGIAMALGMATEVVKPRHMVEAKQGDIYNSGFIGDWEDTLDLSAKGEFKDSDDTGKCMVTEYWGKIPRALLGGGDNVSYDETDLVEAVVTIANETFLLRAMENPYMMQDRPIIAYQHDTVPNRFWGRGIAEKGYNAQKTLDAILRAQVDGLALTIHPMVAIDATRIPRGMNPTVAPGKTLLTNGNPRDAVMPFNFGQIDPISYNASADMERYIQMGTGAMDSASPLRTNRRNETASGMSMIMSGALKRSKRTLQNIERNFLVPLAQQSAWRYMEFDPEAMTPMDPKFKVNAAMGMMAREMEVQQLIQVLQYIPPNSPGLGVVVNAIIEHMSVTNKEEIQQAMLQPDPMVQRQQQMAEASAEADITEKQARAGKNRMDALTQIINATQGGSDNKGK